MRNLKRALSLALSTVMLLGMMVVGTGASYKDVSSKHNEEAIDVMKAVGVMIGDDKGNFNPDKNVTRAEMAVVMANLLDLKVSDFNAAKLPFTDVPAWAAPYVAACYADGITAGVSATKYGANDSVTAAQAALMMMKALGYFQNQSDFGSDWQLATVKQASKINLFDGIKVGASAAMTRNDVAQIGLNTLEATMVESDGNGTSIKGDGFEITLGAGKYAEIEKSGKEYTAIKGGEESPYTVQLGEELFDGDLKKSNSGRDDLGRPGTKWTYEKKEVGVYGGSADYVLVLEKDYTAKDLQKTIRDLADNDDLEIAEDVEMYVNGAEDDAKTVATFGNVLEVFCDDDVITDVVALDYDLAKIEDVSTKLTKAQKDDGATCKIKVEGKYYLDIDFADFDEDEYVEDAYILYVAEADSKDNVILASELAETVEGKVTSKKGSDVKIDGEWYGLAEASVKVGDKGTFYLNKAGQITMADTSSAKSDNYAYIYNTKVLDGETNDDGFETEDGLKVYVVLADGTKASYVVEEDSVEALKDFKGVVAYSLNSDDEFEIETAKDDIADEAITASVDKNDAKFATGLFADGKTEFIFVNVDGSKVKVSTATGYKNVNIDEEQVWTVADDDTVLYAFVMAKDEGVTTDAELAVVLDDEANVSENEDGDEIYTYAVAIDGEETELTFEKEQKFAMGDVISYTMDGDYAEVEATLDVATIEAANDDYVVIDGKQYNLGEETVYTITMEYEDEDDTTVDTVTVNEGGKLEADSKIFYTLDDGDLDIVFVIEEIR